jgi:hypothetical protein
MNTSQFRFVGSKALRDEEEEEKQEKPEKRQKKQPRLERFFATTEKPQMERVDQPTTGDPIDGVTVYKNVLSSSDVIQIEDAIKTKLEPVGRYGDMRRCILTARENPDLFYSVLQKRIPHAVDKILVEEFTGKESGYKERPESSQYNLPPCSVLWIGSDFVLIFTRGKDQMAFYKTHQGMLFVYQRPDCFDGRVLREFPMKSQVSTVRLGQAIKRHKAPSKTPGQVGARVPAEFRVLQLTCYLTRK